MSNFLSIATITAALCDSLQKTLDIDVPNALVRPARPAADGVTPQPTVNIYLFQVIPSAPLRNEELPYRRSDGSLAMRPRITVDLHYLFSFHGDDTLLEPQRMLGSVLRTLEAAPYLTRANIEGGIASGVFQGVINDSDLLATSEAIKFSLLPMSVDELSRLWGMFINTTYSVSVAYSAGAVALDAIEMPMPSLPVKERNVYAFPFRAPMVDLVDSAVAAGKPILSGQGIVLTGTNLRADVVQVQIDETDITPSPTRISGTRIELTAGEVGTLSAGIHRASVVQPYVIGTPPTPHAGAESNVAAFFVHPKITVDPPANVVGAGPQPRSADLTVHFVPDVEAGQKAVLMMNGISPGARSFSFRVDVSADVAQITFKPTGLDAGTYLVRVQVDGAESLLDEDADPMSATYGQWTGPKAVIP